MAFDDKTRNRLNSFVTQARELLTKEFTQQCQVDFGLNPKTGEIKDLAGLRFDDEKRQTAIILRETIAHYYANLPSKSKKAETDNKVLIERVIREQAFTILNRLCAVRMAEARDLIIQSVAKGVQSKGFQLYQHVVGPSLGSTGAAYEQYLFSLFDEFAIDLAVLFDRFSPQGRLFPRDTVLMELIGLINDPEINHLWAEDETIGWIYQYFNSKEERKAMRDASQAPRNSRELAVRNQFFTPRYVVEFLTDNTLGRIWYEMRQGNTPWVDDCQYLVRRPDELFLAESTSEDPKLAEQGVVAVAKQLQSGTEKEFPEFSANADREIQRMIDLAHTVNACIHGATPSQWQPDEAFQAGDFGACSTQQILDYLFMTCRNDRHGGDGSIYKERWFVDACNEVRRRILRSRESDLSQEEMLRAPVVIPYRPLKDPRDIRMLDPACGSMHFGLYAFDLYLKIYDEYWDLCSDPSFREPATEHRLPTEEYADKAVWMKAAPKLIIEHNIHGIDIDPRAVQIAGLSLWLRAQRAWKAQEIAAGDRPQVTRSNVVCAEPMPGDQKQLAEFCKTLHPAIAQMLTAIFEEMKLAGEAGSLLKIEEQITSLVAAAKKQWEKEPKARQLELFGTEVVKEQQLEFDLSGITDEQFFEQAEEAIYEALRKFANETSEGGFRRKLFAKDAERGFSFIEIFRKKFDSILMNPPFGAGSGGSKRWVDNAYKNTKHDMFGAFVERGVGILNNQGRLGAITSRTGLFLSSFEDWREQTLLRASRPVVIADLGLGVLDDAMVEVAAYCIEHGSATDRVSVMRLVDEDEANRGKKLNTLVNSILNTEVTSEVFESPIVLFQCLPTKPFAYWAPKSILKAFRTFDKFEFKERTALQGASTCDDFRYVRLWWEVEIDLQGSWQWKGFAKGGRGIPFYNDVPVVIPWDYDRGSFHGFIGRPGRWNPKPVSADHYFQPALTWPLRGVGFSAQALPAGCAYSVGGKVALAPVEELGFLLGVFNSDVFNACISLFAGRIVGFQFETGIINSAPLPMPSQNQRHKISELAVDGWSLQRQLDQVNETSHAFTYPELLQSEGRSLKERSESWNQSVRKVRESFIQLRKTLEEQCNELYQVETSEFRALHGTQGRSCADVELLPSTDELAEQVTNLISWLVGVAFGRFDASLSAIRGRQGHLGPFDEYGPQSPGMLNTWPCQTSILVDDQGHPDDLMFSLQCTVESAFENANGVLQEAADALNCGNEGLRKWIRKEFFRFHHKRYSKSHREAPIYWPLSTESGSYTLWFYYHHLTDQTLYKAVNDFIEPKLKDDIKPQLNNLRNLSSRSSAQENELAQLAELESELEQFKADLLAIAPFWKPNLNDGVQITAAPLWKFFRHTEWRNKLKKTWEELQEGDYDWAHLALSIWPERVVKEKCTTDRSIAIAHDLEDKLWHEVEIKTTSKTGKVTIKTEWQPRKLSDAELNAIVAEVKRR